MAKEYMDNVNIDAAAQTNAVVFGAAAFNTIANSACIVFPRSKALGKPANPNDNEGMVQLIHSVWVEHFVRGSATAAVVAGNSRTFFQIRRRDFGAAEPDFLVEGVVDEIAFEDVSFAPEMTQSAGTASALESTDSCQNKIVYNLKKPIVMVRPYYLKMRSTMSSAIAQTLTDSIVMYLEVESIRVKGQEYRRLLDAYTKMTRNPRGTA